MRHAIIRFLSIMGIDVRWFVAKPKPDVFKITKLKFHNVLQGVACPGTKLTSDDKALYEQWCANNAIQNWIPGPFQDSSIIVIDDPQCNKI